MFLDPTSSHLLITTTGGEIYYLHNQLRTPRPLSRLKGVVVESVAWNPSLPTASTREILVGASDGHIWEVSIEPSTEFYRREEKYLKSVYKTPGGPITGLWADLIPGQPDLRRVMVATNERLLHFVGKIGRNEGSGSIYTKLFETEAPITHDIARISASSPSLLAVSPDAPDSCSFDTLFSDRIFAWLSSQGVFHGKLLTSPASPDLGNKVFSEAKLLPRTLLPVPERTPVVSIALTQWHILHLVGGRVIAVNRLDDSVVYDQEVLDASHIVLGLAVDQRKNTFWLFTNREIYEIVVSDEDRDIWKIMLKNEQFDAALRYARTPTQRDAVATASGDYLVGKGQYLEAAGVYGKSSKPFEQVSLTFIDHGEQDALRKYLQTKLSTLKRSSVMQRVMVASWLVQIFMSKLNSLDDTITTKAELSNTPSSEQPKDQLPNIRTEFQEFVMKYKSDLDRKTTYDIISSHGREEELLFYASSVNDYNFVLSYWVQRERWTETLNVLKKQTKPEIFYKYSSVLMSHVPMELVDILTRQSNINPRNLIPALLNYNKGAKVPLGQVAPPLPPFYNTTITKIPQNQAVRYLLFAINQLLSSDAAVHNTLISIYASHPSKDESALLAYLESQSHQQEPQYDADFALRLCIQHKRVQSCVHIYSSMEQYLQAVELALKHDEIDLASMVADRPEDNPPLRKKLWLAVAKKVISQSDGIKT
jgi:vacuolar protein sorting-associated protein 18